MANLKNAYKQINISKILEENDRIWIEETLSSFPGGEVSINQMWKLLDKIWVAYKCDQQLDDERIADFYRHPVWIFNGLHIETDALSRSHRMVMSQWIRNKNFKRIADFGGGFGGLARIIADECPSTEIEVIDPYSNEAGIYLSRNYANIKYCEKLNGKYDLIIATDVFEHVSDPLELVGNTSRHLNKSGYYLIGNCFRPVILCHLPTTFHFGGSWDMVLSKLGLEPRERVSYARAFRLNGSLDLSKARVIELKSRELYKYTKYLPVRIQRAIASIMLK